MAEIDTSNPCLAAERLSTALHKLLAGEAVAETEFQEGNGARRRLKFHVADIPELRREIERLERLCAASKGQRRARVVRFSTSKGL